MKCPKPLKPFWKAWCSFSHALGRIASWIILTILWLTFFSAYGITLKVIGIVKPQKKGRETYWVDPLPEVPDGMKHQF